MFLSIFSQFGSLTRFFSYPVPNIIAISIAKKSPSTGSMQFGINAVSIGTLDYSSSVKMGSWITSTSASKSLWSSTTSLLAKFSNGMLSRQHVFGGIFGGVVLVSIPCFHGSLSNSWTYLEAAVSVISHSQLPVTGAMHSVLFGRFMGLFDVSMQARMGASSSVACAWTSDSVLTLKLPPGFGSMLKLTLSVGTAIIKVNVYSFQTVSVLSISNSTELISGLATAGERIIIFARNLAQVESSSRFKFDATAAEVSVWYSDSSVTCQLSHGLHFQSRVVATLGQLRSVSAKMLSNSIGWAQTLSPTLPTTGSLQIPLKAFNLGIFQTSQSIRLGFSSSVSTKWTSDSSILLRCSSGIQEMISILISLFHSHPLNANTTLSYFTPIIAAASSDSPTSGATNLQIRGNSFGTTNNCERMRIGQTSSPSSFWISDSQMICKIPEFSEASVSLMLSSSGKQYNNSSSFMIRNSKRVSGLVLGSLFPLTGSKITWILGKYSVFSRSPSSTFVASHAELSSWISDSSIATKNGRGCGKILQIKVSADVIMFLATINARFELPWVSDISPSNAPTTGHSYIILYGGNLGSYESSLSVSIGDNPNLSTKWISDSTVQSMVPRGFASPAAIVISVASLSVKFSAIFSYDFLSFSEIQVENRTNVSVALFAVSGSQMLTLKGMDFGGVNPSAAISNGFTSCEFSRWISDTLLVGKLPKAAAGFGPKSVQLSVDLGWSSFSYAQNDIYEPFNANMMFGIMAPNTGTSFTIYCHGMRASDQSYKLKIVQTTVESSQWISDSAVKGKFSATSCGQAMSPLVITGFLQSLNTNFSVFCDHILKVGQSIPLVTTGAAFSTISGSKFSSMAKTSKTRIGFSAALSTQWSSDSSLIAKIQMTTGFVLSLHVSTETAMFEGTRYFAAQPSVYSVSPSIIPITGYVSVSLVGRSFGLFETSFQVYVANRKLEQCRWTSDSSIFGIAPPGIYQASLKMELFESVTSIDSFLLSYKPLPIVNSNGNFADFPLLLQHNSNVTDMLNTTSMVIASSHIKDISVVQPGDKKLGQVHLSVILMLCFKELENTTLIEVSSSDRGTFGLKLSTSGLFLFMKNSSDTRIYQVEREGFHLIVFSFDGETLRFYLDGSAVARSFTSNFQDYFDLQHICIICNENVTSNANTKIVLLFAMAISERDMDSMAMWIGRLQNSQMHPTWDATTASRIVSVIPTEFAFEGRRLVAITATLLSVDASNIHFHVAGNRCNIVDVDLVARVFTCVLPSFCGFASVELTVDGITTSVQNTIKTGDPVINYVLQSPITGGQMTLTLFGSNFGSAECKQNTFLLRVGAMDVQAWTSVIVISRTNRILELIMLIDIFTRASLISSLASVEIDLLQSNFVPMMLPMAGTSCQSQFLQRNCLDCCLRKCMQESARSLGIRECESVCSKECHSLKNECSSPEVVLIAQTGYGDCVNISWHYHQKGVDCTYEVQFSVSSRMYKKSTKSSDEVFCGFMQHDLLQDIKIATFNHMAQLISWSASQSFQIVHASAPSKVLDLVNEESHGVMNLSWKPPIHHGATLISKYCVYFRSSKIFVDCCTITVEKGQDSNCVYVAAINSIGEGDKEYACMLELTTDHDQLEISNVEDFNILPGNFQAQAISLVYNGIRSVRLTVTKNENDISFVSNLSPSKMDLVVALSESACGTYSAVLDVESSLGNTVKRSFNVNAKKCWANLAPRKFSASSKTTITVFGCFEGIVLSSLNFDCKGRHAAFNSSRTYQKHHEFDIASWDHASCISSIYLSYQSGPDIAIVPFNGLMRGDHSQPTVSIAATITKFEPMALASALIKTLTVTGAGFSNIQVDWGVADSNAGHMGGDVTMKSVLFSTSCETISVRMVLCEVPDWTKYWPSGLSLLLFYESNTGFSVLSEASDHIRVEFLPLMTTFTPSFANAIGGSVVTLQGFGFDPNKIYMLQNSDIQNKNLVFKMITATMSALTFKTPIWIAGSVERMQLQVKDLLGNVILREMIEFEFVSNVLKLFPTSATCLQVSKQLVTLTGLGFSPEPTYTALFSSRFRSFLAPENEMSRLCAYKSPKTILCPQVDWCLNHSATLISVSLVARYGADEYTIRSIASLEIQFQSQIGKIQPISSSLSGSGVVVLTGVGFPQNTSQLVCRFQFRESILNTSATFSNTTTMICEIPSWGLNFAAQTVLVYFASGEFFAPLSNSMSMEFLPSSSNLHPSLQSIYGGTLVQIEGSGFDRNAPEFKCIFLQGTFTAMTPFTVANAGSGSCATPFWSEDNLANRSYEVVLVYGHDARKIHAGFIQLA